jgi:hypothetical protein
VTFHPIAYQQSKQQDLVFSLKITHIHIQVVMSTHQNQCLAHPHVITFGVNEGLVTAMANDGRGSHCTKQVTTSKACPGQRGGSQSIEWWPSSRMQWQIQVLESARAWGGSKNSILSYLQWITGTEQVNQVVVNTLFHYRWSIGINDHLGLVPNFDQQPLQ